MLPPTILPAISDDKGTLVSRRVWSKRILALAALSSAWCMPAAAMARRAPPACYRPALEVRRPTQAALLAVARAGQRLVAAGEHGLIIVSDDAGLNWTQARVPVSVSLTSLRFADALRGWAVGNMGVVLCTLDGGQTWERVLDGAVAAELTLTAAHALLQANPAVPAADATAQIEEAQRLVSEGADKPFLHIAQRADGSLLAVGAYGLAFESRDDGRNWAPRMRHLPNPEGMSYYGLAQRGSEQFLFGEQGLLLRAESPAGPFVAQDSPSTGSLFGALVLREGPLLLMGLRGKVFRSAERGAPWTTVDTPVDASLFAGVQLDDGMVVLVGAAGQLLISRSYGQHFWPPDQLATRFPFTGIAAAPDGALILVGQRGLVRVDATMLRTAREPHWNAVSISESAAKTTKP